MNECTNKSKRKKKTMNTEKFEEFISQYPIFEYRILDTKDITIQERVRTICQEECERYDSTWACPPAVGTLQECEKKIKSYPQAVFFSPSIHLSVLIFLSMPGLSSCSAFSLCSCFASARYSI